MRTVAYVASIFFWVAAGIVYIAGWWKYRRKPANQHGPVPHPNRMRSLWARYPRLSLILGVAYFGLALMLTFAVLPHAQRAR